MSTSFERTCSRLLIDRETAQFRMEKSKETSALLHILIVFAIGTLCLSQTKAEYLSTVEHPTSFSCSGGAIDGRICQSSGEDFSSVSGSHGAHLGHQGSRVSNAFASIELGTSNEFGFVHPVQRLHVENQSGNGGWVTANNSMTETFKIKPIERGNLSLGVSWKDFSLSLPLKIKTFKLTLYDHGTLFSPAKQVWFGGYHEVSYQRDLDIKAIWDVGSGSNKSFVNEGDRFRTWRAKGEQGQPATVDVGSDGPTEVSYTMFSPFNLTIDSPGVNLDFDYRTKASIFTPSGFRLDHDTTAYAELGNTMGISGLSIIDENDTDVTHLFEITSSNGTLLFVPEPHALPLPIALGLAAMIRRDKSRRRRRN